MLLTSRLLQLALQNLNILYKCLDSSLELPQPVVLGRGEALLQALIDRHFGGVGRDKVFGDYDSYGGVLEIGRSEELVSSSKAVLTSYFRENLRSLDSPEVSL